MAIVVTTHNEQEEKTLIAFLESHRYEYSPEIFYGKRQTLEEYNEELETAVANIAAGNFTTQEQLEKEMRSW